MATRSLQPTGVHFGATPAADEGSYYVAVNATDNTAITSSISTTYSGTASGFIAIQNRDTNSDVPSGRRIYMDYIKLITKVAPANATDLRFVIDVDNVLSRFTSGGTSITPVNCNMASNSSSVATVNVGALTTVALSAQGRTVMRDIVRTVLPVTLETYIIVFGAAEKVAAGFAPGAGMITCSVVAPPVVLNQNSTLVLSLFGTAYAITAATYQVEIGWVER